MQLTDRGRRITPPSRNGVNIGAAYTTALNFDVNIIFAEHFWLELELLSA